MSLHIPAVPPPFVPPDLPWVPPWPEGREPSRLPAEWEKAPRLPPGDWPGGREAPRSFPRRRAA
jgi:hypothetical protein